MSIHVEKELKIFETTPEITKEKQNLYLSSRPIAEAEHLKYSNQKDTKRMVEHTKCSVQIMKRL